MALLLCYINLQYNFLDVSLGTICAMMCAIGLQYHLDAILNDKDIYTNPNSIWRLDDTNNVGL